MSGTPNCIAAKIHRYVEWKYPGEQPADKAHRGIAHYNCAVTIANGSLIALVASIALTCIHPLPGSLLTCLSGWVHYKTTCHLNSVNQFLYELALSFIRQLNTLSPNDEIQAKQMAERTQPINLCVTSWHSHLNMRNLQGINFPLSQN